MAVNAQFLDTQHQTVLLPLQGVSEMSMGSVLAAEGYAFIKEGCKTLIIDLSEAVFLPVTAIHSLGILHKEVMVSIISENQNIKMLLNSSPLTSTIQMVPSLELALQQLLSQEPSETQAAHWLSVEKLIQPMDDHQKYWCLVALANIIVADGNVGNEEITAAEAVFEQIALDEDKIIHIQQIFQNLEPTTLPIAEFEPHVAKQLFHILIKIAGADQEIHPRESEIMNTIGYSLGYSPQEILEFIKKR